MGPLFVGGTGRSGTTIVARLVGAHPAYHVIPIEVRFVTDQKGLCDLLAGRTTFERFERRLLGQWFYRELPNGETRGLHTLLDRALLERALRVLGRDLGADPWRAGRAFVHELLDPLAASAGAQSWIEMTPPNVEAAGCLLRLFPDTKLIHSVRDGRDVACSVTPLVWGPKDLDESLDWWADHLEQGFAACDGLPPDRVILVNLEDLAVHHREREYARLLGLLELEDDPAMRAYFETVMTPERAHVGRWVNEVPADRRTSFEAHHRALVDALRARGRPVAPV
jgi:Sulfotransferase family